MSWPGWNPDNTAETVRRYAAGESSGIIAKALGCTRSTIIGKLHRLGITRTHAAPLVRIMYVRATILPPTRRKPPTPLPEPVQAPIHVDPVGLMELTAKTCRWPVGGEHDQTLFCGAKPDVVSSYCAAHHAVSIAVVHAVSRPGTATNLNSQAYMARRYG